MQTHLQHNQAHQPHLDTFTQRPGQAQDKDQPHLQNATLHPPDPRLHRSHHNHNRPPNNHNPCHRPNTQSCTAVQKGCCIASYGIHVGIPFNNGVGCNDVYDAIESESFLISNWQCQDDGEGMTQLYFNFPTGMGGKINSALEKMYPTVNGFNCPDY